MILKQLLGTLVTLSLILFTGTIAWFMVGSIFPALIWIDFVRLAGVGILIVVAGRLVSDFRHQLDQLQGKQKGEPDDAQLSPRPSEQ